MKRLLAVILAITCLSVQSAPAPIPLGYIITGIQLITANQVPVYYVKVQSTGPDFNSARQHAFKLAVEQAVGILVLSESEMRNSQVTRNEIITYSSGFIDKFNILEQEQVGNSVKLTVEIWVASSAISNRLFNSSSAAGEVHGSRISVQINSLTDQRKQTDQLVDTFMRDYPTRAFDIGLQPVKVEFNSNRQANLYVPFWLRWNKQYLDSLEEVVRTVNQYPGCKIVSGGCPGAISSIVLAVNILMPDPVAWFNDTVAADIMHRHMVQSPPVYRLILNSTNGQRYTYCFPAPELDQSAHKTRYLATFKGDRVVINGTELIRMGLSVSLDNLNTVNITSANVDIVRRAQC